MGQNLCIFYSIIFRQGRCVLKFSKKIRCAIFQTEIMAREIFQKDIIKDILSYPKDRLNIIY